MQRPTRENVPKFILFVAGTPEMPRPLASIAGSFFPQFPPFTNTPERNTLTSFARSQSLIFLFVAADGAT
jgi:hypothetical protein